MISKSLADNSEKQQLEKYQIAVYAGYTIATALFGMATIQVC